jgi:serine/threonine protein kinase
LKDDPACVTYLAEITEENGARCKPYRVVVKFVGNYGIDVHGFLARKGWAPNLLYYGQYGDFQKTRPSDKFLKLTQNAPPGLNLNGMRLVIMEHIDVQLPPENAHEQVKEVLTLLHANGFVFGELRPSNVLFDVNGKVKFIDFNWCGRFDMKIRYENLPDELQK